MSGWLDSKDLECCIEDNCPLYDSSLIFGSVFILIDYFPTYLSAGLTFISFYSSEFFFFYLWICIIVDMLINVALKLLIDNPTRFPNCGSFSEMPSYSSQLTTMLNTLFYILVFTMNRNISSQKIVVLNITTLTVLVARIYIGINTLEELIIGALIGFLEGVLYGLILYKTRKIFGYLLSKKFFLQLGLIDTICNLPIIQKTTDSNKLI